MRELGESPALPRIDPRTGRAFNRLHDHRAAPLALARGDGALAVHWTFDDAPLPPCDAYRFRLGTHAGYVALDVPAQVALLGEARLDRLPKELRTVLLAEAAQAWIDALEKATRQRFEWAPGEACEPFDAQRAACFRVVAPGGEAWRGFVQFEDPAALDAFAPPLGAAGRRGAPARLRFPLRFRLGETRIRLHEVRGIGSGDILSIEHWRAAGAAVVVSAELGGAAGMQLTGLAEGTRITLQQTRDDTMNRPPDMTTAAADARDAAELPIDRLDALEVTLRFEVGDLLLSLGELKNLRPGHVFELGQPLNRSPVRILAHGNLLGKGTLVAVGDRLGVRVSEFAPGEL